MNVGKRREKPSDEEKIDFEQAMAELEEIVHTLEDGQIGLVESLARYEKGVGLLRQCYNTLDGAQRRIELLTSVDAEGRPVLAPVDDAELTLAEKADRRSRRRTDPAPNAASDEGGNDEGDDMDVPGNFI